MKCYVPIIFILIASKNSSSLLVLFDNPLTWTDQDYSKADFSLFEMDITLTH